VKQSPVTNNSVQKLKLMSDTTALPSIICSSQETAHKISDTVGSQDSN